MKKNTVRLTESQLHNVIKESVKRVLKEDYRTTLGQHLVPYYRKNASKEERDNADRHARYAFERIETILAKIKDLEFWLSYLPDDSRIDRNVLYKDINYLHDLADRVRNGYGMAVTNYEMNRNMKPLTQKEIDEIEAIDSQRETDGYNRTMHDIYGDA